MHLSNLLITKKLLQKGFIKMIIYIIWIIISYLVGSLNTALIYSKIICKNDIRNYGSKNSGSTNITRVYGKKIGFIIFIIDILKPILIVLLANIINPDIFKHYNISYLPLFIIIGQCYPIFFNFIGGKGAACTLGMLICIYPKIVLFSVLIFILLMINFNTISLSGLTSIFLSNIIILIAYQNNYLPFFLTTILVFYRHKQNIINIINKNESTFF